MYFVTWFVYNWLFTCTVQYQYRRPVSNKWFLHSCITDPNPLPYCSFLSCNSNCHLLIFSIKKSVGIEWHSLVQNLFLTDFLARSYSEQVLKRIWICNTGFYRLNIPRVCCMLIRADSHMLAIFCTLYSVHQWT